MPFSFLIIKAVFRFLNTAFAVSIEMSDTSL